MLSILQNAGPVEKEPYPHVVIENALPNDLYFSLLKSRPHWWQIAPEQYEQNERYDLPSRRALMMRPLSAIWREFIAYHTSIAFWMEWSSLFGIDWRIGLPRKKVNGIAHEQLLGGIGVRGWHNTLVTLDCQIGINTPVTEVSRVRGPHLDHPIELMAGMLYMPLDNDGGDLIIYEKIKEIEIYGKSEIKDHCVREVKRVPYKKNTAVFFLNGLTAIHGVSERNVTGNPRQLVNFIVEHDAQRLFNIEKYRVEKRIEVTAPNTLIPIYRDVDNPGPIND